MSQFNIRIGVYLDISTDSHGFVRIGTTTMGADESVWSTFLIIGKCKCLHTGHGNLNVNYKMGDTVLGTIVKGEQLK